MSVCLRSRRYVSVLGSLGVVFVCLALLGGSASAVEIGLEGPIGRAPDADTGGGFVEGDPPAHWNLISTWQDVPEYSWYYGCSPTAAGMLMAWWDAQPGRANLFEGDASSWYGNGDYGTKRMVASRAHQVAGDENGLSYGTWKNSTSYPDHESNPDCLADFMKTHNGGTYRSRMAAGFENFAAWDDPSTDTNESLDAEATTYYTYNGWDFDDFKAEIDAGRPVHLGITGHSILALGWWDQSTASDPGNYGYVCYTTWGGWGMTEWRWDGADVPDGRNVYGATYLEIVPEPVTLALMGTGGLVLLRRRHRS